MADCRRHAPSCALNARPTGYASLSLQTQLHGTSGKGRCPPSLKGMPTQCINGIGGRAWQAVRVRMSPADSFSSHPLRAQRPRRQLLDLGRGRAGASAYRSRPCRRHSTSTQLSLGGDNQCESTGERCSRVDFIKMSWVHGNDEGRRASPCVAFCFRRGRPKFPLRRAAFARNSVLS